MKNNAGLDSAAQIPEENEHIKKIGVIIRMKMASPQTTKSILHIVSQFALDLMGYKHLDTSCM